MGIVDVDEAIVRGSRYRVNNKSQAFISKLPKAELHVHIEGTLEPELMLALASRQGRLDTFLEEGGWTTAEEAVGAMRESRLNFRNLEDFLSMYNKASSVLVEKRDFYALMAAYIACCKEDNVRYAEIFFDPQSHMERGVPIDHVIDGLHEAIEAEGKAGRPLGCRHADRTFHAKLVPCVLRDWKVHRDDPRNPAGWIPPPDAEHNWEPDKTFSGLPSAMCMLEALAPHSHKVLGLGMDNAEVHTRPKVFKDVYQRA
eukprot:Sspe_Gene.55953::Locus_30781_Transcript_1_1_Confidence_1.000_Length_813::g.55953::m.55953/K21053/ade; adenine deaminase